MNHNVTTDALVLVRRKDTFGISKLISFPAVTLQYLDHFAATFTFQIFNAKAKKRKKTASVCGS